MHPQKIGHYEIREKLGAGGMGEVFKATDTRLGRDVALKFLPESFANDPVRMARLEREARMLASLNHPNIATIHGIEESEGKKALVMELIAGEDLSARIARGALPLADALTIAIQIARALEAAHQKGVVHCDLKPANVKLTSDGQVKVLDFGLAKSVKVQAASGGDLSSSPTLTAQATQIGLVHGTAAYMSPEQARGKAVDARSDVFSFGCVLFEMLAGGRAFSGEDISEILASVIKHDVRWDRLPTDLAEPLKKLLARCLEGRVEERYQAIGDVRYELVGFLANPSSLAPPTTVAASGISRGVAALVIMAALLAGALATWALRPSSPAKPLVKFRIAVPDLAMSSMSISPDGRSIATIQSGTVALRRLDQLQPRELDLPWKATLMFGGPAFSRDGRTLVIQDDGDGDLWRVPVDGGEPQLVTRPPSRGFLWGVTALGDDQILFGMADGGLFRVPLRGGDPEVLLAAGEGEAFAAPHVLPNGRDILFAEINRGRIEAFDGSKRTVVLEIEGSRIFEPKYSVSGHLLFRRDGGDRAVWAVPFSAVTLKTTGPPFRVLPYGWYSLATDDTLVFQENASRANPARLVWVDRRGSIVGTIGETIPWMNSPVISPDQRHAAVEVLDDEAIRQRRASDIFVFDLRSGTRYQLRDDVGSDRFPFWRAGGTTIGFVTYATGIRDARERAMDGTGETTRIRSALWAGTSRDGRYLLTHYWKDGLRYSVDGSAKEPPPIAGEFDAIALSPDTRFLAYTLTSEPGLFVKRFPEATGLIAVASGTVTRPLWSVDGSELFYWKGDTLMAIPISSAGDEPKPGTARVLFSAADQRLVPQQYDVAVDGRFLMLQKAGDPAAAAEDPGLVVIQNWAAEFERK